jgi:MFS family permease
MGRDFAAASAAARTALLVFLPFATGYFLSYLYRSVNAVISTDLVDEFGLSASALGLLTSAYFLGFASLQIPVGLMLDRIGPRRTNSFLLLLAGSGAMVFAMADGLSGLLLGRALVCRRPWCYLGDCSSGGCARRYGLAGLIPNARRGDVRVCSGGFSGCSRKA